MASINVGKVVAGGIVAGLVANAIDFVTNTYVLGADLAAFTQAHNMDAAALTSPPVAITWVVIDFVIGLLLVWTYAAMRPRFGPGAGTAVLAGLVIFIAPTIVLFGFTMMGFLTMAMWVKGSCGAVVSTLAASIAGASIYKEESPASGPAYTR